MHALLSHRSGRFRTCRPSCRVPVLLALALVALAAAGAGAQETILQNDGFVSGGAASFQSGFVAGEMAAVRLTPAGPFPVTVTRVQFLFGGVAGTRTVTLHIWDDAAGTTAPGTELFAGDYELTASNTALQDVDLTGAGVQVSGPFRVGIEFQHDGLPSVARDVDGIGAGRTFIEVQGFGWADAALFGVTGDWVLRAGVQPVAGGGGTVVQNDSFGPGQSVAFQGGFVAGETAAARLVPAGPFPLQLNAVRFLFGGAGGTRTVTLHVWADAASTWAPGAELYVGDYTLTAADDALQEIDLSALGLLVSGPFRVGLEFQHSGLPSVARDGGGITADRNFVEITGSGWLDAAVVGITGDWVIRAVVGPSPFVGPGGPQILAIADVRRDQGRSVRLSFARSNRDAPGSPMPITTYEVYRRADLKAGAAERPVDGAAKHRGADKLAGWDYVGATPAHGESAYSLVVPTLADSTIAAGQHWSVFQVRASTASPYVFFDSAPDSGWSVDNLAPGVPAGLVLAAGVLNWQPSTAADFDYFSVYGSPTPYLGAGATLLARTTATGAAPGGAPHAYYLVTATDFAGNEGAPAVTLAATPVNGPTPGAARPLTAWPNPFNPRTTLAFGLAEPADVAVEVFALDGTRVRRLLAASLAAGEHQLVWDGLDDGGRAVAAGAYVARMRAGEQVQSRRLMLVR